MRVYIKRRIFPVEFKVRNYIKTIKLTKLCHLYQIHYIQKYEHN